MKKLFTFLSITLICIIPLLCPAESEIDQYSWLDDLTINQLKELDTEIHKRIPIPENKENAPVSEPDNLYDSFFSLLFSGDDSTLTSKNPTSTDQLPDTEFTFNNCHFKYINHELTSNKGKKLIQFYFEFTNNSSKATSSHMTIKPQAFQNGIALKERVVSTSNWSNNTYSGNTGPEIQPGKTIITVWGFELIDTSDVTFELANWGLSKPKFRRIVQTNQ